MASIGKPDRWAHMAVPSTLMVPAGRLAKRICAAAARPDGADDRAVGKNAAHACGAIETSIGKQLADDERPGLFGPSSSADGRGGSQHARTDDSHAQQHCRLHIDLQRI